MSHRITSHRQERTRKALRLVAVASLGASLAFLLSFSQGSSSREIAAAATQSFVVAIDADPTGNSADAVGAIDDDVSLSLGPGATFQVDIVVTNFRGTTATRGIASWTAVIRYNDDVIQLADPATDVTYLKISDATLPVRPLPGASDADKDGAPDTYGMGAAIFGTNGPGGSGTLARLTFTVVGAGASRVDILVPGENNLTVFELQDDTGAFIEPDRIGDATVTITSAPGGASPAPGATSSPAPGANASPGPGANASPGPGTNAPPSPRPTVTTVPGPSLTPSPTSTAGVAPATSGQAEGDDGFAWWIVAAVGGGVAAAAVAGGLAYWRLWRRG